MVKVELIPNACTDSMIDTYLYRDLSILVACIIYTCIDYLSFTLDANIKVEANLIVPSESTAQFPLSSPGIIPIIRSPARTVESPGAVL
jgi:hypothetical protein